MAENVGPVEVYNRCADQWISDKSGGIHVDNSNIVTIIDLLGIDEKKRLRLFDQVKIINRTIAELVAEESERQRLANKK